MEVSSLVTFIKNGVLQDNAGIYDPEFGQITDAFIQDTINLIGLKLSPPLTGTTIPSGKEYYLSLLARRELYIVLSTKSAPLYKIEADNTKVEKDSRFKHYINLVQMLNEIIKQEDPGNLLSTASVSQVEVSEMLSNRGYFSLRAYNLSQNQAASTMGFSLVSKTNNSIEVSWNKYDLTIAKFARYDLYLNSDRAVYDKYKMADKTLSLPEHVVSTGSLLQQSIYNIHKTFYKIENLTAAHKYYLALFFVDWYGKFSVSELEVTTES